MNWVYAVVLTLATLLVAIISETEGWTNEQMTPDLDSIPERSVYILKDYELENQRHHAKDIGLTEEDIKKRADKVESHQMKMAIFNKGHPRYHITVWIGNMVLEGNDFISGQIFEKENSITGRKCKSVYTVKGSIITGGNIYDNEERVTFEAIVKRKELLITLVSKSGRSELKLELED